MVDHSKSAAAVCRQCEPCRRFYSVLHKRTPKAVAISDLTSLNAANLALDAERDAAKKLAARAVALNDAADPPTRLCTELNAALHTEKGELFMQTPGYSLIQTSLQAMTISTEFFLLFV